jgi:tRNA (guanine10-N2)-dimethyltransferase
MMGDLQTPFLFELSGEHPTLPLAELLSTVKAESPVHQLVSSGPGYAIICLDQERIPRLAERLALTHRIGRYLGRWGDRVEDLPPIPDGSIALRVRGYREHAKDLDVESIVRSLGKHFSSGRRVDLTNPDVEVRGIVSDQLHLHVKLFEIDRSQYDLRKVKERPYFSPISLHPRYARALVNLTGLRAGQCLLDPFCGTGGTLIEAALLGLRPLGSDISPTMIEGCRSNMEHFGLDPGRLEAIDIGSIGETFGKVDAVASDPPYGRSTSTNKEELGKLYARSMTSMRDVLTPGGRLAIVFPRSVEIPQGLRLEQTHTQKVHRSLNRYYSVMERY